MPRGIKFRDSAKWWGWGSKEAVRLYGVWIMEVEGNSVGKKNMIIINVILEDYCDENDGLHYAWEELTPIGSFPYTACAADPERTATT